MKKKNVMRMLAFAAALQCFASAGAEAWSLDSCVSYAIQHNIDVRSRELQNLSGELTVTSAKDAFLPTVNASAGESFSFGRGLTTENTYVNRNTSNFQWGVSANVPLFQGLEDVRRLKYAKSSLKQLLLECEAAKDNVELNVISQYLQVLYAREVKRAAQSQFEYSEYEVNRQRQLVEAGKVPEADLFNAEAQMAQDRLQVVSADNDVQTQLIILANLLQLPSTEGFDIQDLEDDSPYLPSAEKVWEGANLRDNSLLAARQAVTAANDYVSMAKTGYMPRLSFSAGTGSSYYTVSGMKSENFGSQMRHNLSTYLGFNLSIPIFDAFSTRNNVRRARLQRLEAELEVERRESELQKNIRLAHTQATGAREKYLTSDETLTKTRQSFEATREKYSLGRSTPYEFEQAKNNLFRTEVNRIQALYEYILRCRILRFYQHEPLL